MGLRANLKIAKRALTRRKTKNLSAILAIALGVTLMVGIQITTDTLENTFLTSLLVTEGEVDIRITNATGTYLSLAEEHNITSFVTDAITSETLGIMPELQTEWPVMINGQFEPSAQVSGIPVDFPEEFGTFYDWKSGNLINIGEYLTDNTSVLIGSKLADALGMKQHNYSLPMTMKTELNNATTTIFFHPEYGVVNQTTSQTLRVNLTIMGVYDSNRPGIGAQYPGVLFAINELQDWVSLDADPLIVNMISFEISTRRTDFVNTYLVALFTDHFNTEIDVEWLEEQLATLEEAIPKKLINGNSLNIYNVESPRLQYLTLIDIMFGFMSAFLNVLGFLIIITGVLLITNIQLMSVEDREFQTGVLRAVGARRRGIFQSMLFETVFQGIFGGIFGLIGGLVFGQVVALFLASLFSSGMFSVQPIIEQQVVVFSVILGVFLGILTGLLPAIRASRVNIVLALRGIKVKFEEKSGRNLVLVGILSIILGILIFLNNGVLDESLQYIWEVEGWDSVDEWTNILLGSAFLFSGLGIVLSRYIDRVKALNLTAFVLWATPVFLFVFAMGDGWIADLSGMNIDLLIISIILIVIGSVLLVGINLAPIMQVLRGTMIKIKGIKGVAQVAPALISSHKTRSTLTFAIFAVVLTLNVTVATLVATNFGSSIGQTELDSRGIDLIVKLNKPEVVLNDTSYANELYKIDSAITDVLSFKTYRGSYVAMREPDLTKGFDFNMDILPISYVELRSEQILGNATEVLDEDWRYDFYLDDFPDGVRPNTETLDFTDEKLLELSRRAWKSFFDPLYKMPAYNVSFFTIGDLINLDFSETDFSQFGSSRFGGTILDEDDILRDENGTILEYPVAFTDSFLLPLGKIVWIPMNSTEFGPLPIFQPFVIGGSFDSNRAGGFPLGSSGMPRFSGEGMGMFGSIYIPERYSKYTNFFGEANGETSISRKPNQFDSFLIKTTYQIDDPKIDEIGRRIETFTNTDNKGYRSIGGDDFLVATAISLYSSVEESLEMMTQMTNFLSIYVNFGLIIGSVGMAVISVRNVAERRREIGMMRAIGFPRSQVMLSALLELVVLGMIGLIIGVTNGLLVNIGFANMMSADLVVPWSTITAYLTFITFVALLAGSIPGWVASRIPAAEALRYVG